MDQCPCSLLVNIALRGKENKLTDAWVNFQHKEIPFFIGTLWCATASLLPQDVL